eukprot:CAMPEP_0171022740 /NCGR_PEP_ID=MMETSP0736-20130129/31647_1 /TAXON_ID=186038 /ORGANISM="Fragilariopsis kerguelensis, Strain L26-C5" /LENGTH=104 /DNA_ID=CAMNT_0011461703 /DNA_START=520 /DNA_END=831 /DNA_ORIENTATION=-
MEDGRDESSGRDDDDDELERGGFGISSSECCYFLWNVVGLALAVANAIIWTYNLFVFLLLRTLPQYINRQEFPVADVTWKGQLIPILASTSTSTSDSSSNNNNN